MSTLLAVIATCFSGIFSGAAIYITLVAHPARLECGPPLAVTEFAASYRRHMVLPALAFLGFLSAAATWLMGSSAWWLVGGIILVINIPFSLIKILPINKQLLNPALDKDSPYTVQLLIQWGKLHRVRSLLGLISFLIFLLSLKDF